MELTKNNIVNRVNKLLISYKVTWDDIIDDLDMAIDEINNYMSTKYPPVSKILHKYAPAEATYSYRAGGVDTPFFSERFFHSIVIPYVITRILTIDEEFTTVYSVYLNQYQENLFVMARDEMSSIPAHLFSAPRGVYFANPNPVFKADPEAYFNAQIEMDVPKLKVTYSWGNILLGTEGVTSFVSKPLPIDNNSYEIGSMIVPVIMQDTNFNTFVVDSKGNVLGTFLGWSLIESGDNRPIINEAIELTEDVRFYAVFDYDIVRFKYLGNGGTVQNWKPMYINGSQTPTDVVPFGGTAVRPGHKFVGFDPEIITAEEINNKNELDDINDYVEEEELTFTAQWNLMFYTLTFAGRSQPILGRSGYVYGEEFDLLPPPVIPGSPDEFIGWWDNIAFQGDPVTKIYESDYGDKVFYGKYNEESFMIVWQDSTGYPIKQEVLSKNTLLNSPAVPEEFEYMNQNNGLYYIRQFQGFVNEAGDSPTKAIRNDTFTATYVIVPITDTLEVIHNVNNEGTIEPSTLLLTYQLGKVISKNEIIALLGDKRKYTNLTPTIFYTSNLSTIEINGTAMSGTTFIMSRDIKVYSVYTQSVIGILFQRQIIDPTDPTNIIIDPDYDPTIDYIPENASLELLYSMAKIGEDDILTSIATTIPVYLDGFQYLVGDVLTEIPNPINLTGTITVVPIYSETKNLDFVRKITIIGMPQETSTVTTTEVFEVGLNETIDLIAGTNSFTKNLINENDEFLYLKIEGFYLTKIGNVYSNPITEITALSNITIYAKTESKKVFSIFLNSQLVKDFFPYQLVSPKIIDATRYDVITPVHPTNPTGYKFIGWNQTEGHTLVDNYVTLTSDRTTDVNFYPVFVEKKGFKVNLTFTSNYVATETNFTRDTSPSVTISAEYENTSKQVFGTYNDVINLVNSVTNGAKNEQQWGYEFYSWKQNLGPEHTSFPVFINLPSATDEIQEINLNIELRRRPYYYIVTVQGLVSIDTHPTFGTLLNNHYVISASWYLKRFIRSGEQYLTHPDIGSGWIFGLPRLINTGSLGGFSEQYAGTIKGTYYYASSIASHLNPIPNTEKLTRDRSIYLVWKKEDYVPGI